jgi:cytochrome c553
MKTSFAILAAAGLLFAAQSALADGDAAAGKDKAQTCAACHGLNGISSSDQFPILAGQYKDYIIQALHEYKNGERTNSIMKGMAAGLSEDDIQNLAEYFSGLPGPLNNIPQGGH